MTPDIRIEYMALPTLLDGIMYPATEGSAGIDLAANINGAVVIYPGEIYKIPTGIKIHIANPDYVGLVVPRSSLGVKRNLGLANTIGIIDSDYQGEIFLFIRNLTTNSVYKEDGATIWPGDRLCQLLIMPLAIASFVEVDYFGETSNRGEGGFGSTGQ